MEVKRVKHPNNEEAHLPPEMWAAVMNHLDFSSVLPMTATSRAMRDAAPLVSELHINKSCQLHVSVGRRFRDVRDVFIYSFVPEMRSEYINYENEEDDEEIDPEIVVDFETTVCAVPFLSTFSNLERVLFGGCIIDEGFVDHGWFSPFIPWHRMSTYLSDETKDNFARMIDMISAGFRSGLFQQSLEVKGLACPFIGDHTDLPCALCVRACQSFPIKSVAYFEHDGSSSSRSCNGEFHDLDICIGRELCVSLFYASPYTCYVYSSSHIFLTHFEHQRLASFSQDQAGRNFYLQQIMYLSF
jgi:hypothetical protein